MGPRRPAVPKVNGGSVMGSLCVCVGEFSQHWRDEHQQVELEVGDYACFAGDVPHSYLALAPASAAVLVMEYT